MRKLIALIVVLTFAAVPAFGQGINWDGSNQTASVTVNLLIPTWAQVQDQDVDGISFSGNNVTGTPSGDGSNNSGGDWWSITLGGYYSAIAAGIAPGGCGDKASTDPWAGAEYITGDANGSPTGIYYEALDYAHHFVRTNTNITGTVGAFNSLSDGAGHSIPAWFTMGFAPFWDNGTQITTTNIPYDGQGGFLSGSGPVSTNMAASPVALNSAIYNMSAPAFGTITMHARILRKGMMDVAGTYTGTITVSYN